MNAMTYEGKKLNVVKGNFNYILNNTKFEGRRFLVDEEVLESIVSGDALPKMSKQITIKSYFCQTRKRKVENPVTASTITVPSGSESPPVSFTRIVESSTATPVTIASTESHLTRKEKNINKKKAVEKKELRTTPVTTTVTITSTVSGIKDKNIHQKKDVEKGKE